MQTQNSVYILAFLLFLFSWESMSVRFQLHMDYVVHNKAAYSIVYVTLLWFLFFFFFFFFFFFWQLLSARRPDRSGSYFPCVVFGI